MERSLTGRYQQRFGFDDNSWSTKTGLPTDEVTVADYLKAAGYATFAIGKWHEGQLPQFRPLVRGFTDHYGFLGGGRSYFPKAQSAGAPFVPKDPDQIDLWRNEIRVEDPEYLTDALGDAAVDYIGESKDRPFFIYLAFNAPHVPLQATEKYLDRFASISSKQRRTYAAMVSAVDDAAGKISEKLRFESLQENTLLFFLSDNGGHPIANAARNAPLRGEKGTTWEGGIRVPFVVKWTGRIPAGIKYTEPVISLDITATALALAGATPSPERPLDGVNLVPFLTGEKTGAPHETLYWRFVEDWAVRHGDWKLTMSRDKLPRSSLPAPLQYMGAESARPNNPSLFDLSQDISESTDLSNERPDVARKLQDLYDSWNAEVPPPQPRARPRVRGVPANQ